MGVLGYTGEAWDPGKVFEDEESRGKAGGEGNAGLPGIKFTMLHPRADESHAQAGGLDPEPEPLALCLALNKSLPLADSCLEGPCNSNVCGTVCLAVLCSTGAGNPNSARSGHFSKEGATGRERGILLGPRGPQPTEGTGFPNFPAGESGAVGPLHALPSDTSRPVSRLHHGLNPRTSKEGCMRAVSDPHSFPGLVSSPSPGRQSLP